MRILVTGGAGYIGSTVAAQLVEAGHQVMVFDNLSNGYRAAVPGGAQFALGDTLDRATLDEVMAAGSFEAVIHFAAFIEAGESMREPGRFYRNNVAGSLGLIDAAVMHGVSRFVFSSTAGVYASKDSPLDESDAIGPASVYGATKWMVEQALEWYARIYGLRVAILRYFNAAGATEQRGEAHRPETHLVPLVLQVPLGQRPSIAIFGDDYPTPDGTCIRDYIHIADLAAAHLLALEGLGECPFMRYNVGNGNGYSVLQVVEAARDVTGHPIPVRIQPRRSGDSAILVAASDRIQAELGWRPRCPDLTDIIASAWRWHQNHPNGYGGGHGA